MARFTAAAASLLQLACCSLVAAKTHTCIPQHHSTAAPEARFIAAAVPSLNLLRLALVGSGAVDDPGLVKSTSRR